MNNSAETLASDYGTEELAMQQYLQEGESRALRLNNRGPIRFAADGTLDAGILEAYWRCGFYIFEGVIDPKEVAELKTDFQEIRELLPTAQSSLVDAKGRAALGTGHKAVVTLWSKPLADPLGGTAFANGRHQVKMFEPTPPADAPKEVVYSILGLLQFSEAALRLCGHPKLLAVAAVVNGEDFVPFTEAMLMKEPGLGNSIAWHQDGVTHWNSPTWSEGAHGFNFMAQLFGSTAANGLWVVPGSHKLGKLDIKAMVAEAGSERLPNAVPYICKPGDIAITNRQLLHGSFANTSRDWRVTINFGFHPRKSVLGFNASRNVNNTSNIYDADYIDQRARVIGYAIDARHQHFPNETSFRYRPHVVAQKTYHWDSDAKSKIKDYNLLDLFI